LAAFWLVIAGLVQALWDNATAGEITLGEAAAGAGLALWIALE
jgi:hypothetical protein